MWLSRFKIKEYLFYLLIFILPWQTRWIIRDIPVNGEVWEYGRISLYGWDILLIVLLVISWPLMWQEAKNFKIQSSNTKPNSKSESLNFLTFGFWNLDFRVIYLLLLLYTLVSIFWSTDKLLAMVWSARLLEGGILWLLIKTIKPKLNLIFLSLAFAGTIQALWGISQFLTQSTFANKWLGVAIHPLTQPGTSVVLTSAGRWLRAYAGQVHPNVLGGLLVITCLVTVWLYLENVKIKNQNAKWLLVIYVVQLAGLFFTFSRGAWLALFITLGLWWWKDKHDVIASPEFVEERGNPNRLLRCFAPRNDSLSVMVITALVFIILGVLYWQPTVGRFMGGSKLEQQSIDERVGSIGESRSLLRESWWHGVGMGNYTVALISFEPGYRAYRYQPVHNIFLLILTEFGIIGLIFFIWLLWLKLKTYIIRNLIFIIPITITSLFDHYWWTIASMFMLLWLILFLNDKKAYD
jgi:hypothetical protein